ncbi:substrate-binding domain-containing protein [Mycobacterium sp. Root265]|uniref:substrate-binding domain-containing protein n=1 Tax=Mycobacterium sp. Root265 TaxID=1736504 RepID=UPI000AE8ED9C
MNRLIRTAVAATAVALSLAACSSTGGKPADQGGEEGSVNVNLPRHTVAMVGHWNPSDAFVDILRKGAAQGAETNNVELRYSSDPQPDKQATLVQNAIDSKVDAIALDLANPEALLEVSKKAVAAGIPVVAFNSGYDDWKRADALMYIGQDEVIAGTAAGERLKQAGASKVLCVVHEQGVPALDKRCNGVEAGFGGRTERVYLSGFDMSSARSTVEAKLAQDPAIDAIITLNASYAMTALPVAEATGRDITVATFDTNPELMTAIKDGKVAFAVDQQPWLQGYQAVDTLANYLNNRSILGGGQPILTGPSFIDDTNVEQISAYATEGVR